MSSKLKFLLGSTVIILAGCGADSEQNLPSGELQKASQAQSEILSTKPKGNNKICIAEFQTAKDVCLSSFRGRDRAVCMQEATAQKKACLSGESITPPNTFLTFIYDESDDLPLADNLSVFVDGAPVSSFDEMSHLAIFLAPGPHDIQVVSSTRSAARFSIEVESDSQINRTVVLKSEALGLIGDYDVAVLGADDDGIINVDTPFTIGVTDSNGVLLPFDTISMIRVARIESGSFVEGTGGIEVSKAQLVQNRFTAQGASATLADASAFEAVVRSLGIGEYIIEVALYDSLNDRVYEGVAFFRYGERTIEGTVDGPFDTGALEVDIQSADGTIQKTAVTDANGSFVFQNLPAAVYQISVVVDDGDTSVRSAAGLVRTLLGDKNTTLTPITLEERDAGASEIEVLGSDLGPTPVALKTSGFNVQVASRRQQLMLSKPKTGGNALLSETSDSTSVTAGSEGQAVKSTASVDIPSSSNSVTLEYSVQTNEYPEFVLQQSEFDDQWRVRVFDERGTPVFSSFSNVNSQLNSAAKPELVWTGGGTTQTVTETIELAELQTSGEDETRSIRVELSATNIGDDILPTTVQGTLEASTADLNLEWVDAFRSNAPTTVPKTVISIPDSGNNNTYNVLLSWAAKNSETGEAVSREDFGEIKAEIKLGTGGEGEEIFTQEGVEGPVTAGGQAGTFRTNIAFTSPNPSSPVSVNPPTEQRVQYEVELKATIDDEEVEDTASSGSKTALYSGSLTGETRAGNDDAGGDDWATEQTHNWLVSNTGLLGRAIGDVSGEHGRNIGHSTHKDGGDNIFNSAATDAGLIIEAASDEDNSAEDAEARLTAFVASQRAGISALTANGDVEFLYGPHGAAADFLPGGWLDSLIRNGSFTATNEAATVVNIGGSLAAADGYINRVQNDHNDHYHVRIEQN